MSDKVQKILKNAEYGEMSFKSVDVYRKRLSFADELEAMKSDMAEVFGEGTIITTSDYGMINIKVRTKKDLDAYMGKLDELGRFSVQKRELRTVIIYNITVEQGRML